MGKILYGLIFNVSLLMVTYSQELPPIIRISKDIEITKLSEHAYIHTSYADMPPWKRVPSNGLIYVNKGKAFLFDTPTNDTLTKGLVKWIEEKLKAEIIGIIPNHWHSDCMGGLRYLQKRGIDSYAYELTRKIAATKKLPVPRHGFSDSLDLQLGGEKILWCGSFVGQYRDMDTIGKNPLCRLHG